MLFLCRILPDNFLTFYLSRGSSLGLRLCPRSWGFDFTQHLQTLLHNSARQVLLVMASGFCNSSGWLWVEVAALLATETQPWRGSTLTFGTHPWGASPALCRKHKHLSFPSTIPLSPHLPRTSPSSNLVQPWLVLCSRLEAHCWLGNCGCK